MAETKKHKRCSGTAAAAVTILATLAGAALPSGLVAGCLRLVAFANEVSYTCTVLNTYELENDGSLRRSGFDGDFRGERFTVSRANGQITGSVVPTLLAQDTDVLSYGDSSNSFRTIASFASAASGRDIQVLYVQEFVPGKNKPFVVSSMGGAGIVTGTCE